LLTVVIKQLEFLESKIWNVSTFAVADDHRHTDEIRVDSNDVKGCWLRWS